MVEITEIEEAHRPPDPVIHENLHYWTAEERKGSTSVQESSTSHWDPGNLRLPDTVFLSHSGVDKPFAITVYEELLKLDYVAFLDKVSLPKATIVTMKNILQVAKECRLAVFFLSDHFFLQTPNPMLELAAAIESKRRLLPLFYGLTVKEFKDKERRKKWFEKWKQWEEEESGRNYELDNDLKVNAAEWERALKIIGDTSGVEFERESQSEKAYIESVIYYVRKVVPPDLRWDDSKIQGKERLCQSVESLFSSKFPDQAAPRILGLFGMGGMGKTTLCTALLNFYSCEFNMKVCCIELESGQSSQSKEEELKRVKKVLKALTGAHEELVERASDVEQGWHLLKRYIQGNKVFLAVDNVSPETEKECLRYLEGGFQSGSKIVITGRSSDLLETVLRRQHGHSHVTNVPSPIKEEATGIFVQELGHGHKQLTQEESSIVQDCLKLCRFDRSEGYHALALVALAALLGDTRPQDWKRTVEDWQSKGTKGIIDNKSVFDVLVIAFAVLTEKEMKIFIEIALFVPRLCLKASGKLLEWLNVVHEEDDVNASLKVLRKRALLNGYRVHDLHREMAVKVVNEAPNNNSKSLFWEMHPKKLINQELFDEMVDLKSRCTDIERIGFVNCEFEKSLDLSACPRLRVLKLIGNKGLREVVMGQNRSLRSLEVEADQDSRVAVRGLKKCSRLGWLSLGNCVVKDPKRFGLRWRPHAVGFLSAVRFLNLKGGGIVTSHLQGCKELEQLTLTNTALKQKPICLSNLTKLREVRLVSCGGLEVLGLGSLPGTLELLDVHGCKDLVTVDGLESSTSLTRLDIQDCHRLRKISAGAMKYGSVAVIRRPALETLVVERCSNLVEVHGLDLMKSLEFLNLPCANIWDHEALLPDFMQLTELRYVLFVGLDGTSVLHRLTALPNLERCDLIHCTIPSHELVKLLTPQLPQVVAMGVLLVLKYFALQGRNICNDLHMGSNHLVPLFISFLTTTKDHRLRCPRCIVLLLLHTFKILKSSMFHEFLGATGMIDALLHQDIEHPTTMPLALALIQSANKEHQVPIKAHVARITMVLVFIFFNINFEDSKDSLYTSVVNIKDVARRACMLARHEDVMAHMKEINTYHLVEPRLIELEKKWL